MAQANRDTGAISMSNRKPSAAAQQRLKTTRPELKDLAPKAPSAQQVKGGPSSHPWARLKGKNS